MKLIKYPKVLLFAVLLFLAAGKPACAQLWTWEDEIYFRLENDSAKVIPGATVYLNGVKMEYSETCGNFGDHTCYRCPKFDMDIRVHLAIQHPQYLPFSDSIFSGAKVQLFRPGNKDYYYEYVKVPYEKTPDTYVSTFSKPEDSIATVKQRIEAAGGTTISEFSACGAFNGRDYGPRLLLYLLPKNDSTTALLHDIGRTHDTGPWVKRKHHSAGIANSFRIYTRYANLPQAKKLFEQMKSDSVITYFSITPGSLSEIQVYLEKGNELKVQPLIEKLLATGLFCDPYMDFYVYECLN